MPEKPKTQREMIEQLWYAHYGTDGAGAESRLTKLECEWEEFMRQRFQSCPWQAVRGVVLSGRKYVLAVVALVITAMGGVLGIVSFLLNLL